MINVDIAELERKVLLSYMSQIPIAGPRDPYKELYSKVKGVPYNAVTAEQRALAKDWTHKVHYT